MSDATYNEVARQNVPDGSFRYGQLASVEGFDVPESSFAICFPCARFEDGSTEDFRTVLVAHFLFSDTSEDEARETAAQLQASEHVGDVTLVLPARYSSSAFKTWGKYEQPMRETLDEGAEAIAAVLGGTPAYALFPRWYTGTRVVFFESSSGSRLATLDVDAGTFKLSEKLGGTVHPFNAKRTERIGRERLDAKFGKRPRAETKR